VNRILVVNLSESLALGALLLMFTPFLQEFTPWHISGEWLAFGAFLVSLAGGLSLQPARRALVSLLVVLVLASAIEGAIIALPASRQIVLNPVSYIIMAEQLMVLGCVIAGPFTLAGGVLGVTINLLMRRSRLE
jgi:hypothetical protein